MHAAGEAQSPRTEKYTANKSAGREAAPTLYRVKPCRSGGQAG